MPSRISPRARSGVIVGVKPFCSQQFDRVLLQRQLQQHRFVLQEVEAVAGRARPAFEVDQVELSRRARRDRAAVKSNLRIGVAPRADLACCRPRRRSGASGCVRFGIVALDRVAPAASSRSMLGLRGVLLLRGAGGLLPCGPRARPHPSPCRSILLTFVRLPVQLFDFAAASAGAPFRAATSRSTSPFTPRLAQFCLTSVGVFENEFAVEHDWSGS